jgi:hypothetical protein
LTDNSKPLIKIGGWCVIAYLFGQISSLRAYLTNDMEALTPVQIMPLTQTWRDVARTLTQYQARHWDVLTTTQHLDFNACQNSLLTHAETLEKRGVLFLPGPTEEFYTDSIALNRHVTQVLPNMNDVSAGYTLAAMVVALASGLIYQDARNIRSAQRELKRMLAEL